MLRTFTMPGLSVVVTGIRRERRVPVPAGELPQRPRIAVPVLPERDAVDAPLRAPWGEPAGIDRLASVTTRPVPEAWWRRPRLPGPPSDPFERPVTAAVHSVDPPSSSTHPRPALARPVTKTTGGASSRPARREAAAKRRGRFARFCLVVAGALISFMVVDAAAGRGRR